MAPYPASGNYANLCGTDHRQYGTTELCSHHQSIGILHYLGATRLSNNIEGMYHTTKMLTWSTCSMTVLSRALNLFALPLRRVFAFHLSTVSRMKFLVLRRNVQSPMKRGLDQLEKTNLLYPSDIFSNRLFESSGWGRFIPTARDSVSGKPESIPHYHDKSQLNCLRLRIPM